MSVKLHGRHPFLILADQIHRLKPESQRQFRGHKNRPGSHRGLMMAAVALLEFTRVQLTAFIVPTLGAYTSLGSSPEK